MTRSGGVRGVVKQSKHVNVAMLSVSVSVVL